MTSGDFQYISGFLEVCIALNIGFSVSEGFRSLPRRKFESMAASAILLLSGESNVSDLQKTVFQKNVDEARLSGVAEVDGKVSMAVFFGIVATLGLVFLAMIPVCAALELWYGWLLLLYTLFCSCLVGVVPEVKRHAAAALFLTLVGVTVTVTAFALVNSSNRIGVEFFKEPSWILNVLYGSMLFLGVLSLFYIGKVYKDLDIFWINKIKELKLKADTLLCRTAGSELENLYTR